LQSSRSYQLRGLIVLLGGLNVKQLRMGRTGLKVSEICLGTMTFAGQSDEATSFRILDRAFERGVTFIDTADAYPIPPLPETAGRTEEVIGRWLGGATGRRHQIVLATKCRIRVGHGPNDQGLSRRHILTACEASLRRLQTLRAFDDLVRSGKVRYVGCSNYPAWQLALALSTSERHGWARYDCVQPRYNVLYREIENELLPLCRDQGVGVIVFNPLAGGMLTGKHEPQAGPEPGGRFTLGATGDLYRDRYWHAVQFEAVDALKAYCKQRGWNLATASVAWVLGQPGITSAIVGASRAEQLEATLDGAGLVFDDEARAAFDAIWWSLPRKPLTR
jgi:aryl-alcohol dehydrogenase-like predicted oxidoreductase